MRDGEGRSERAVMKRWLVAVTMLAVAGCGGEVLTYGADGEVVVSEGVSVVLGPCEEGCEVGMSQRCEPGVALVTGFCFLDDADGDAELTQSRPLPGNEGEVWNCQGWLYAGVVVLHAFAVCQ